MKKIFLILLILCLVTGCGSSSKKQNSVPTYLKIKFSELNSISSNGSTSNNSTFFSINKKDIGIVYAEENYLLIDNDGWYRPRTPNDYFGSADRNKEGSFRIHGNCTAIILDQYGNPMVLTDKEKRNISWEYNENTDNLDVKIIKLPYYDLLTGDFVDFYINPGKITFTATYVYDENATPLVSTSQFVAVKAAVHERGEGEGKGYDFSEDKIVPNDDLSVDFWYSVENDKVYINTSAGGGVVQVIKEQNPPDWRETGSIIKITKNIKEANYSTKLECPKYATFIIKCRDGGYAKLTSIFGNKPDRNENFEQDAARFIYDYIPSGQEEFPISF